VIEYRRIVVPHDFSEHADEALRRAADLAERFGAELHLVHVVQQPLYSFSMLQGPWPGAVDLSGVVRAADEMLGRKVDAFTTDPDDVQVHVFEGTNVAEVLLEAAAKLEADLIVMGTHGRTGLAHVLVGSVTERTLRRARCPVLAVRLVSHGDPE
jgi:universal stress protein A